MSTFGPDEIMKMLPHRYPFLFVDRIVECDGEKRIVGLKNIAGNEPYFQGHFPGVPIMPGVLQLEAMAQTAGILVNQLAKVAGVIPYFLTIDKAKFRKVVKPGDQLRIEVDVVYMRAKAARFHAQILVDGAVVSEADMMCMITDQKAS